ncbi:ketosteroid isomerase-related protein [Jiulongibacter sp. NS-SX5]|uniref:ketosteroid isomerase-related protein n=1 Tax=Jiulongibacter sp. NS-SX5 TaxID=3463854 RepID=UPI0040593721
MGLVEQYYSAFNQKDWETMLSLLDENVRHDANQGGANFGKDYFKDFLHHMDECYNEELKDLVFMYDSTGERIAAEFTVHGTYKSTDGDLPAASGQTYILPAGAFLEGKNEKITRVTTYYNLEDWLRQIEGN